MPMTSNGRVGEPRQRYYVTQYGYVWSLTLAELRKFLHDGAQGHPYDMRLYGRELAGVHQHVGSDLGPRRFWGEYVIHPLDWEPSDFAGALKELEEVLCNPST